MAENSKIEWTDHTFNPWVGCTKISPACDHCYAEAWAKRSGRVIWGEERKRTSESYWRQPIRWNAALNGTGRRARVFCCSLADVFDNHRSVEDQWRSDLFGLIRATPNLDWLLLTKRIGNVADMIDGLQEPGRSWWPLPNVWLGITVVNQEEADRDVPKLLDIHARVRFLSCEPLLGGIDLCEHYGMWWNQTMSVWEGTGAYINRDPWGNKRLHWVIAGGESGGHARFMDAEWCNSLRRTSEAAGAAFFMKQGSAYNWAAFKDMDGFPVELRVRQWPASYLRE